MLHDPALSYDGYTLFSPNRSTSTFLIDNEGLLVHSWESTVDQQLFGQHDAQWIPAGYPGEGNILIYEEDKEEALKVLRHEILDYCVSQAIDPYKEVTNRLIRMINEDAYKRKERVVAALTRLMETDV